MNLRTTNLILSALTWRVDGTEPSAMVCADDAIKCALRGNAEGCARRAIDGLRYQVGIGHAAYQRSVKLQQGRI